MGFVFLVPTVYTIRYQCFEESGNVLLPSFGEDVPNDANAFASNLPVEDDDDDGDDFGGEEEKRGRRRRRVERKRRTKTTRRNQFEIEVATIAWTIIYRKRTRLCRVEVSRKRCCHLREAATTEEENVSRDGRG